LKFGVAPETENAQQLLASVATSINNIGYLRRRSGGKTDEIMAAYQDSLQIKKEILGDTDLSVGKTSITLGASTLDLEPMPMPWRPMPKPS
jgi:hypothetical protein